MIWSRPGAVEAANWSSSSTSPAPLESVVPPETLRLEIGVVMP
jgi:hypothetical protein